MAPGTAAHPHAHLSGIWATSWLPVAPTATSAKIATGPGVVKGPWSSCPPRTKDVLPPSASRTVAKVAQDGRRGINLPQPQGAQGWPRPHPPTDPSRDSRRLHLSVHLYIRLPRYPVTHPSAHLSSRPPSLRLSAPGFTLPSLRGPRSLLGPAPGLTPRQVRPHIRRVVSTCAPELRAQTGAGPPP